MYNQENVLKALQVKALYAERKMCVKPSHCLLCLTNSTKLKVVTYKSKLKGKQQIFTNL